MKDGVVDFGCGYRVPIKTLRADVAGPVDVAVRPEEFTIRPAGEPGIPATVRSSVFLGMSQHYFVTLKDGQEIEVVVPSDLSEIIPDGPAALRRRIEQFVDAGASKFVVIPVTEPADWTAELEEIAEVVVRPVEA